ncbi:MAG: hypothetical protein NTX53_03665 [candidate division WOR-3 bacterium]|nr:hypothetical protein [candidate division WOR-3 bacterium]
MSRIVLAVAVFVLFAAPAAAQWSTPVELPSDSADESSPAALAVRDSNLYAVWVSTFAGASERQIRGSMYEAGSGRWNHPAEFTGRSSELASTGPSLTADPIDHGIWVAFYKGSFPVDDDAWGIYTVRADSTGIDTPRLAMPDTGVGSVLLRSGDSGRIGMAWTDVSGAAPDFYSSVWFSMLEADTWTARLPLALGMGTPVLVDCAEPALCRDSGDRFFAAWSRIAYSQQSHETHIIRLPDTATIGVFPGSAPAIAYDMDGSLLATNTILDGSNHFLITRFYRDGLWTDPETLSSNETPNARHRLCVDTEGLFWIVYSEGYSPPMHLFARYYAGGVWSSPESIGLGTFNSDAGIISTYSGGLWAVWSGPGAGGDRVFFSRRNGRPGVAERGRVSVQSLRVLPTISGSGFTIAARTREMVTIYSADGRAIAALRAADDGQLQWNGTNRTGSRVPPGVYAIRSGSGQTQKVVVR